MSETRLFIARHGETEYNKNGLLQGRRINAPLNETGKKQAELLAGYLKKYPAGFLASSSLLRAEETAGFYMAETGLSLIKNPDLDEMDFGDLEGASFTEAARELNDLDRCWRNGDVFVQIPGGESPKAVFDRASEAILGYVTENDNETLVFVIHGRLIRILLSEWLGYGLKNMHKIEHQNGAVNQLIYKNGVFEPVYLNKVEHLNGL